jgi:hypothetical protein
MKRAEGARRNQNKKQMKSLLKSETMCNINLKKSKREKTQLEFLHNQFQPFDGDP